MPDIKIINNDCLVALRKYPDNHFDSVVSDPPYGINFMGKKWDYDVPSIELWKEVLRVLKPGGHILIACGTRTQHRMAVNIEDAGFEIRDIVSWIYGSGFPKALDISKAIDNNFGLKPQKEGISSITGRRGKSVIDDEAGKENRVFSNKESVVNYKTSAISYDAKRWDGWKTALKPAQELWTLARKPLSEDTIAENILKYGTGGINIDGCRIKYTKDNPPIPQIAQGKTHIKTENRMYGGSSYNESKTKSTIGGSLKGRFPANVIFDEEAGRLLDEQSGVLTSGNGKIGAGKGTDNQEIFGKGKGGKITSSFGDSGGASRFFYCAKASRSERNKGLENMGLKKSVGHNRFDKCRTCGKYILQNPDRPSACKCENPEREDNVVSGNFHPTVKPVALMRYLVRMITPKGGIVLDPFNGSGTTGIACKVEGFGYVGIDEEKEYCGISSMRIKAWDQEAEEKEVREDKTDEMAKNKGGGNDKEQLSLF